MRVGVFDAAPEIVTNRRNYDGKMVDVWSAGVMLYVMLFCRYPFERPEDDRQPPQKKYQTVQCPTAFCFASSLVASHMLIIA